LSLGYTVLLLAVLGAVVALWGRRWFPALLALAVSVAGALFSFPPSERVGPLDAHFPSFYLVNWLPYFRVYARFAMIVMLGVTLLAAFGYDDLLARARRASLPVGLALIPFLLLAVE